MRSPDTSIHCGLTSVIDWAAGSEAGRKSMSQVM